jgi:hypothetical protein
MDNGITALSLANTSSATNDWGVLTTESINLLTGMGDYQVGKITAFGIGQFTITWIKTGSPTGTATISGFAFK